MSEYYITRSFFSNRRFSGKNWTGGVGSDYFSFLPKFFTTACQQQRQNQGHFFLKYFKPTLDSCENIDEVFNVCNMYVFSFVKFAICSKKVRNKFKLNQESMNLITSYCSRRKFSFCSSVTTFFLSALFITSAGATFGFR